MSISFFDDHRRCLGAMQLPTALIVLVFLSISSCAERPSVGAQDGSHYSKFAQLAEFSPDFRKTLGKSDLTSLADMSGSTKKSSGIADFIGNAVTLPIRVITAPRNAAGGS